MIHPPYITLDRHIADKLRDAGWTVEAQRLPGLGPNATRPYQRGDHIEYHLAPPPGVEPTATMYARMLTRDYEYPFARYFPTNGWVLTDEGFEIGLAYSIGSRATVRIIRADGSEEVRQYPSQDFWAPPQ